MSAHKRLLDINEIRPGMIVTEEIVTDNVVLAKSGVVITNIMLDKLKKISHENKIAVYCVDDEIVNVSGIVPVMLQKTVEQAEEAFEELSFEAETIFENILDTNSTDIEEIRGFVKRIQEEMDSPSAIIKNIVINGSGVDSIYRHSVNVAALSVILGKWIGMENNQINLLAYSAIFHDFGKTKIDKGILDKVQPLTTDEKVEIKKHPMLSFNYIKKVAFLESSVGYGIVMHHERLDGSGYPLGLKEVNIHQFAKVIAIADTFDAVNSDRYHKKRKDPFAALEAIKKDSLGKLEYYYCKTFIEHIISYYTGENVLLNDDRICKIVNVDVNDIPRPLLFDGLEFIDLKKEKYLYIKNLVV